MGDITIEQWMEKYPYLKEMAERIMFITQEEDKRYKSGEKIVLQEGQDIKDESLNLAYVIKSEISVSLELLNKLVSDDRYYEYVKKLFAGDIKEFRTNYITYGDTAGGVTLLKTQIVQALNLAINQGKLNLDENATNRVRTISNEISFEKFLQKNRGNNFNIEIDGNKVSIPIESIIKFLQLPQETYDEFFDLSKDNSVGQMPKEYFVYATVKFFKDNQVFDEYMMPEQITERYNELYSLQRLDVQALNKVTTIDDDNVDKTVINEDLKRYILSEMPNDLSDLEKAAYIYIKMCKTLTYDDEFYAVNQRGEAARKHEHIENVTNISLENNNVVCYEFNAIYAKLLEEMGIKFETDSKVIGGFGGGHANLCFRSGKFLIEADSVTSILQGDMMRAKLNQELVGFQCKNVNKNTQAEFINAASKAYGLIVKQEQEEKSIIKEPEIGHVETFEEILAQYQKLSPESQPISINEKIDILMNKVNDSRLVAIDALSYILQLRKVIFNEGEQISNINIVLLRNNEPLEEDRVAMTSAIFTINQTDMNEEPEQNQYFFYNPQHELLPISKKDIEENFDIGLLEYIEGDTHRIPGIFIGDGIRK